MEVGFSWLRMGCSSGFRKRRGVFRPSERLLVVKAAGEWSLLFCWHTFRSRDLRWPLCMVDLSWCLVTYSYDITHQNDWRKRFRIRNNCICILIHHLFFPLPSLAKFRFSIIIVAYGGFLYYQGLVLRLNCVTEKVGVNKREVNESYILVRSKWLEL